MTLAYYTSSPCLLSTHSLWHTPTLRQFVLASWLLRRQQLKHLCPVGNATNKVRYSAGFSQTVAVTVCLTEQEPRLALHCCSCASVVHRSDFLPSFHTDTEAYSMVIIIDSMHCEAHEKWEIEFCSCYCKLQSRLILAAHCCVWSFYFFYLSPLLEHDSRLKKKKNFRLDHLFPRWPKNETGLITWCLSPRSDKHLASTLLLCLAHSLCPLRMGRIFPFFAGMI